MWFAVSLGVLSGILGSLYVYGKNKDSKSCKCNCTCVQDTTETVKSEESEDSVTEDNVSKNEVSTSEENTNNILDDIENVITGKVEGTIREEEITDSTELDKLRAQLAVTSSTPQKKIVNSRLTKTEEHTVKHAKDSLIPSTTNSGDINSINETQDKLDSAIKEIKGNTGANVGNAIGKMTIGKLRRKQVELQWKQAWKHVSGKDFDEIDSEETSSSTAISNIVIDDCVARLGITEFRDKHALSTNMVVALLFLYCGIEIFQSIHNASTHRNTYTALRKRELIVHTIDASPAYMLTQETMNELDKLIIGKIM